MLANRMAHYRQRKPRIEPVRGDVVVTKVATHYHVSRVQGAGEPLATLGVANRRSDALDLACRSLVAQQRLFLYDRGDTADCVQVSCADARPSRAPRDG
jgi:hypothetical protein